MPSAIAWREADSYQLHVLYAHPVCEGEAVALRVRRQSFSKRRVAVAISKVSHPRAVHIRAPMHRNQIEEHKETQRLWSKALREAQGNRGNQGTTNFSRAKQTKTETMPIRFLRFKMIGLASNIACPVEYIKSHTTSHVAWIENNDCS